MGEKNYFLIFDPDPSKHGLRVADLSEAKELNKKGWGVFSAVNEFEGPRKKENLKRIKAWAIDMDKGSKSEMLERLKNGPLFPSKVVETKRGYHAYWFAEDATLENWDSVLKNRLVPHYDADPNAKDLCRILRTPGFKHWKNPQDPFEVTCIHDAKYRYLEKEMLRMYPNVSCELTRRGPQNKTLTSYYEFVSGINCEEALIKLSGKPEVNGESYTFKENASGTKNIFVNGESTGCWIDKNGLIGSLSNGGPTIHQWLKWFHGDARKAKEAIRSIYPECPR